MNSGYDKKVKVNVKLNPLKGLSGNLLGTATVTLYDVIEIHGWRIMKSKLETSDTHQLWIQEPCQQTNKGWKSLVFINDKNFFEWIKFQIRIVYLDQVDYEKVEKRKENNKVENPNLPKGFDPETDIPF